MPRYWIIAPHANDELYDAVWRFDLANNCISIGWTTLGDLSAIDREELARRVAATYPENSPRSHSLITEMVWSFCHEIQVGDVIVARRGLSIISAVGNVTEGYSFTPDRNPAVDHPQFIQVNWKDSPRGKQLPEPKFTRPTVKEKTEEEVAEILSSKTSSTSQSGPSGGGRFVLESHLQEFIAGNWHAIFPELEFYEEDGGVGGEPYDTGEAGAIDILAVDRQTRDFVVIELKRNRTSDQVVGQLLRYMGWVKKNLCGDKHDVRGVVVCREEDIKLNYAHMMTQNVTIKYYDVSFRLGDKPAS